MAKTKEKFHGVTPEGKYTTSFRRYRREWRAFYRPIEKALGVKVFAFDPHIMVKADGRDIGQSVQIPMWFARRIHKLIEQASYD